MDYVSRGTLYHLIKLNNGMDEVTAFKYFIQVVTAVNFLHENNLIHRDLKPENILVEENDEIKLCDFGWCVELKVGNRVTFCGTFEYMAPELVKELPYDHAVDVWSLGVLLYELTHGYSPFRADDRLCDEYTQIFKNILKNNLRIKKDLSSECADLIKKILTPDNQYRIKVKDIFSHPWVRSFEEAFKEEKIRKIEELDKQKEEKKYKMHEIEEELLNVHINSNQNYENEPKESSKNSFIFNISEYERNSKYHSRKSSATTIEKKLVENLVLDFSNYDTFDTTVKNLKNKVNNKSQDKPEVEPEVKSQLKTSLELDSINNLIKNNKNPEESKLKGSSNKIDVNNNEPINKLKTSLEQVKNKTKSEIDFNHMFNNDKKLDPQSHSLFDKVLNQITSKNKQKRKKTKDEEFSSFSNKLIEDRSVKSDSFNKNANKSDKNISFEAKEYNTHNSKNYNEPIIQIENKKNSFRTIAAIEEGPEFKKDIDLNCTQNIFEFSRLNQNNETYVNFFDGEGDYSMINNFNLMDKENKIPYKTVSKQGNYSSDAYNASLSTETNLCLLDNSSYETYCDPKPRSKISTSMEFLERARLLKNKVTVFVDTKPEPEQKDFWYSLKRAFTPFKCE